MNTESSFQLADLLPLLRRRAKVVGWVVLVVSLGGYWIAMALPNEYKSYATVLVEPQAVDPDIVKAGVASSNLGQRLNLMTSTILSRGRLSKIIDDLELFQEESEYMVRSQVIDLMRSKIGIQPVVPELAAGKKGDFELNTFKITFRDDDARVARDVAQRLANDFIESHIEARVNVSQKSLDFIEGELNRLSTRIAEVENQVAKVKADNPGRLPDDMGALQRQLERAMGELAAAQRRHAEASSDEAFFRTQVASVAMLGGGSPNDAVSPQRRLQVLELGLAEYEALGLTDKHPDVRKAKREIEQVRKQAAANSQNDDGAPMSFAAQQTEAEARRAALRKIAAQEEIDRQRARADEFQALLLETPAVAEQLEAMTREYQHLFKSYQDFSQRRLEAMVQAQLERRQLGEQFRVLEAAFKAPTPSSPQRPMIVMLGVVFGLALGGGMGVLLEGIDGSVHNARQLQSLMNIPVLASIPQIWLESDYASRRRSRIRTALAASVLVVFVIVGGAGSYIWVNGSPSGKPRAEETKGGAGDETASRSRGREEG